MDAARIITEQNIPQMLEKTDLVLDLNEDKNGNEAVDYYFADHELRIIVFVHEFESVWNSSSYVFPA